MTGRTIVAAALAIGWLVTAPLPAGAAPKAPRLEISAELTQAGNRWDRPRHHRRHWRGNSHGRHHYRPHHYRPYAWGYGYKPCRVRWQMIYGYYGPQWVATRRCY